VQLHRAERRVREEVAGHEPVDDVGLVRRAVVPSDRVPEAIGERRAGARDGVAQAHGVGKSGVASHVCSGRGEVAVRGEVNELDGAGAAAGAARAFRAARGIEPPVVGVGRLPRGVVKDGADVREPRFTPRSSSRLMPRRSKLEVIPPTGVIRVTEHRAAEVAARGDEAARVEPRGGERTRELRVVREAARVRVEERGDGVLSAVAAAVETARHVEHVVDDERMRAAAIFSRRQRSVGVVRAQRAPGHHAQVTGRARRGSARGRTADDVEPALDHRHGHALERRPRMGRGLPRAERPVRPRWARRRPRPRRSTR